MAKFLAFFLLIMAILGIIGFWHWQGNSYSKEVLKLEILGPETVQTGEEIAYTIKFKNNGKVRLEAVELVFEYPKNSVPLEDTQSRITKKLEDVYPGEERAVNFKAVAMAKENDTLKAQASLFYNPKDIKAKYESKTDFITKISFMPLTLEFDLPLKAEQGEDLNFTVNYFSNMDFILENLRLKMTYPAGFTFASSKPKGIDPTEWALPTLSQTNGGRVTIQGKLGGDKGESKIFKAQLGVIKNSEFILLKEASMAVEIAEPSVFISQTINSSQAGWVEVGELLHYEVYFKNIGATALQKKFLLVKLQSDFFDLESLKAEKGEVGKGDNSIIFDWKDNPNLRFLDAAEEGKVDFWVKTKDISQNSKIENPSIKTIVSLSGVEKAFETKLQDKVEFAQKVFFQEEVFGNQGPIPPKVGTSTSYTVFWHIKNYWNGLNNVKVKAVLPSNVGLTGKTFPQNAPFTFDSASREAVWSVGSLTAYQGFGQTPYTLVFQIELLPNSSQIGAPAPLIGEASLTGEDNFSGAAILEKSEAEDTSLPHDDTVNSDNGIIK